MPRLRGLERKYADTASDVVYYGLTIAGIAFRAIADESYSIFTSRLPEAVGARTRGDGEPMQYLSDVAISQIGGFTKALAAPHAAVRPRQRRRMTDRFPARRSRAGSARLNHRFERQWIALPWINARVSRIARISSWPIGAIHDDLP
jgi:hypothetical protein